VLKRLGDDGREALAEAVDESDPKHLRAVLLAATPAGLDDRRLGVLKAALMLHDAGPPFADAARNVLAGARSMAAIDRNYGNQLGYLGWNLISGKQWLPAIAAFEIVIDTPRLELTAYNNALYAIMRDNNGVPVDRARHERFIQRALPHAQGNPSIFYNVACLQFELGDMDAVIENLALARKHGLAPAEQMRDEPLFAPLRKDPRFVALFADLTPRTNAEAKAKGKRIR
jgi:hypothetical protein